jgi:hypothetical protein
MQPNSALSGKHNTQQAFDKSVIATQSKGVGRFSKPSAATAAAASPALCHHCRGMDHRQARPHAGFSLDRLIDSPHFGPQATTDGPSSQSASLQRTKWHSRCRALCSGGKRRLPRTRRRQGERKREREREAVVGHVARSKEVGQK